MVASEIGKSVPAPDRAGGSHPKPNLARREREDLDQLARLSAERATRGRSAREGSGAIHISIVLSLPKDSSRVIARSHLPGLEPRFLVAHRDSPLAVYETSVGRIGMAFWHEIGHSFQLAPGERAASRSAIPDILTRARGIENRTAGRCSGGQGAPQQGSSDAPNFVVTEAGSEGAATLRRPRPGIGPAAGLRLGSGRLRDALVR